ncbi:Hypothetical_protein [Hexamita inflata]|uniref:Hypothetical_protein n=1 Tax=Hexamita inflata TaxID=28002 RepID=A0ABP1HJ74_9EUKA
MPSKFQHKCANSRKNSIKERQVIIDSVRQQCDKKDLEYAQLPKDSNIEFYKKFLSDKKFFKYLDTADKKKIFLAEATSELKAYYVQVALEKRKDRQDIRTVLTEIKEELTKMFTQDQACSIAAYISGLVM